MANMMTRNIATQLRTFKFQNGKNRCFKNIFPSTFCSFSAFSTIGDKGQLQCHKLTHRGVVKATGKDTSFFLQGLITNDMNCLDTNCDIKSVFTMLLNLQGRILYDMIIYKIDLKTDTPEYLIECDKEIVSELIKTMKRYKLRKKVDLVDVCDEVAVWAVCPTGESETHVTPEIVSTNDVIAACVDPRIKNFGLRVLLPQAANCQDVVDGSVVVDSELYHRKRYNFGIGEGILDMPPGNSLPLECNGAFMNGVSFNKGCYIGQELTARTHHTGVIRKRLMPVKVRGSNIQPGYNILNARGKNSGKMRGYIEEDGIALLRIEEALGCELSIVDNDKNQVGTLSSWIPRWWPKDTDAVIQKAKTQFINDNSNE